MKKIKIILTITTSVIFLLQGCGIFNRDKGPYNPTLYGKRKPSQEILNEHKAASKKEVRDFKRQMKKAKKERNKRTNRWIRKKNQY